MAWRELRAGDRIRLIADPPEWQQPGYHLPPETRDLWRRLVARRRPLRVYEVDAWGAPWVRCRFGKPGGGWEYHFLAICEGGWVRVRTMTAHATLTQLLDLRDDSAVTVAVLRVTQFGDGYRGTIDLAATPPRIKRLFQRFEETVEGQMFTLADEVEAQIAALRLRVSLPNGASASVENLQVYPTTEKVSFTLRDAPGAVAGA